jgi:hypothetical protein
MHQHLDEGDELSLSISETILVYGNKHIISTKDTTRIRPGETPQHAQQRLLSAVLGQLDVFTDAYLASKKH